MSEFWNGFVYGFSATVLIEIVAVVVYAIKRGGKK
jgi:hypothetical protein